MENLEDNCEAKPQSETNELSEIEASSFKTMETNVEEAIVVPNNKRTEEITKEGEGNEEEENLKEEVKIDRRMNEEEKSGGKVEENSRKKKKKVNKRKIKRQRTTLRDSSVKATEEVDKLESPKKMVEKSESSKKMVEKSESSKKLVEKTESSKKKANMFGSSKKKAESSGMIFMCGSRTKKDCYHYKVLGLPASKKDVVKKIYRGMRLFLFDFDLKLMYGIYKAAGPGGYNIEPKAFGSAFPSQVRFSVLEDCLPLAEEKFKKVIKDNYYKKNKFSCELNSDQVKNLCKLFRAASKDSKSKGSGRSRRGEVGRSRRGEARNASDRRRRTQLDREEERRPILHGDRLYKEPPLYEREVYASPRISRPLHTQLPLLPAAAIPPPSYASYRRPSEMEVYRREPVLGGYDQQYLDLEVRPRDDMEYRDPYVRYREPPLPHDLKYSSRTSGHLPPAGLRPEYYPPAGSSIEHHPPAGLRPEYYPPAGQSIEHHPPAGLRPEYYHQTGLSSERRPPPQEYYTLAGPSSEYLFAGRQPEYLLRSSYR